MTCSFLYTCVLSPSSAGIWSHRHMTHTSGFLVHLWDLKECPLHYKRTPLLNIIIEMSFHCAISMEGEIIFIRFLMITKVIKFIGRQLKTQKRMKKKINIAPKLTIYSLTLTELNPSQRLGCSWLQRWTVLAEPLFLCCLHAEGEADKRWFNQHKICPVITHSMKKNKQSKGDRETNRRGNFAQKEASWILGIFFPFDLLTIHQHFYY